MEDRRHFSFHISRSTAAGNSILTVDLLPKRLTSGLFNHASLSTRFLLQVATLLKHNVVCTTLIDVKTPPCLSGIVVFYIVFRSRHLSNRLRLLTINVDSK